MTDADLVWNRACLPGSESDFPGDRALTAVIRFHGAVMNGGVLHAIEVLNVDEISEAEAGYQFFDLGAVADLIQEVLRIAADAECLDDEESRLNQLYWGQITDDSILVSRFRQHFESHPTDFAAISRESAAR